MAYRSKWTSLLLPVETGGVFRKCENEVPGGTFQIYILKSFHNLA